MAAAAAAAAAATSPEVQHEPGLFWLRMEGCEDLAVLEYEALGNNVYDFKHTFAPECMRGKGVASRLATAAFNHASAHRWTVRPTCWFLRDVFLKQHPTF